MATEVNNNVRVADITLAVCQLIYDLSGNRYSANNGDTQSLVKRLMNLGYSEKHLLMTVAYLYDKWCKEEKLHLFAPRHLLGGYFEENFNAARTKDLKHHQIKRKQEQLSLAKAEKKQYHRELQARCQLFLDSLLSGDAMPTQDMIEVYNWARGYEPFYCPNGKQIKNPQYKTFELNSEDKLYISAEMLVEDILRMEEVFTGVNDWLDSDFTPELLKHIEKVKEQNPTLWEAHSDKEEQENENGVFT